MKVSSDFRVTIPAKIRMQLGMHPGTEVEFIINGDEVFLKRVAKHRRKTGETKTSVLSPKDIR
jgi:AbrB family looped-hinge helix DNA binding protein